MLFYKCLKISLINFLNLPKKGAKRLFRLESRMENNLSTDKQLVLSIRNIEWIDLSTGHKTLRTSIEESINKEKQQLEMIKMMLENNSETVKTKVFAQSDKKMLIPLTENEMKKTNGGIFLAVAAITIAYSCWASNNMGKDGKSEYSNNDGNK